MNQPQLIVMLKAPVAGYVKTRLANSIGPEAACSVYRELVEGLLNGIAGIGPMTVHYAPGDADTERVMRAWLGDGYGYVPQPGGDLGVRMEAAVEGAFACGAGGAILLGGDCPYVDRVMIGDVERRLQSHDVIIGPAVDGGYYLLALRRRAPCLFQGIAWGTDAVFSATLKRAEQAGLSVALLDPREDVDDVPSWRRMQAFSRGR